MINRRLILTIAFAVSMTSASVLAEEPEPWTLVGIGDTQVLVQSEAGGQAFSTATQWVADNKQARNVRFVTQLGDIVSEGRYGRPNTAAPSVNNVDQWDRAEAAMAIIEGASIPFGVVAGNHELDWVDVRPGDTPSSNWWGAANPGVPVPASGFEEFKARFGPPTTPGLRSVSPTQGVAPNNIDTFFIYTAGGREYLHLHLQVDIPDPVIEWAQGVIDANPGLPTILSTHVFEGTLHGPPASAYLPGAGRNSANQIWDKLIKDNEQVFMVLNGHTGQQVRQTRTNAAGKDVFTISQDYAGFDGGGANAAYIRLYEFDEEDGVIRAQTYSPRLDSYLTGAAHQFDLTVNFFERFDVGVPGDLDGDGAVSSRDWLLFRAGHLADLSGLTQQQAYARGDMDGDRDNDIDDFRRFKEVYNAANGAGTFEQMLSATPEPTSMLMLSSGCLLLGRAVGPRGERLSAPTHELPRDR